VPGADVELCELRLSDAEEFVASAEASRVLHQPYIEAPDSFERFATYFERSRREDQVAYLVRHRACGGLVGFVNLNNIVRGAFQSASLGYAAFAGHVGRGLMRQGVALVVERAFGPHRLHRIEANIQPANLRSIASCAASASSRRATRGATCTSLANGGTMSASRCSPNGGHRRLASLGPDRRWRTSADPLHPELDADAQPHCPRRCRDGAVEGALAGSAHHEQAASTELEPEAGPASGRPQEQAPASAERDDGDDGVRRGAAPEAVAVPGNAVSPVSVAAEPDGAKWLSELPFVTVIEGLSQRAEHGMGGARHRRRSGRRGEAARRGGGT
jgi:ribosomal-protein-alanine N-acetyltransferase